MRALQIPGFLPDETTIFMASLKGRVLSPLAKAAVQRIGAILSGTESVADEREKRPPERTRRPQST
jgi:hypothetical protein